VRAPPPWIAIAVGVALGSAISQGVSRDHPRWQGILVGMGVAVAGALLALGVIHLIRKGRRR
jgi:hypothetical protein